jgi:ABC-type transport system substrate-binding protein
MSILALLLAVAPVLTACPSATPQVVEKEVVVEKPVVQTVVVEKVVVATATPEPLPTAVVAEEPVYGGTLRVVSSSDVRPVDPLVCGGTDCWAVDLMVLNGLLRFKQGSADVEPELAEGMPSVSEDGLTYTFKLREGVKFSSGRDLTAHDFKWSFERYMKEGNRTNYFMTIKGAEAFRNGETEQLEGLKLLDDYTVEFTLDISTPYFLQLLAIPWTYVVDKEAIEEWGEDINQHLAGAGPFVMEERIPGQKLVFVKNANYFRDDEPYLDQVIWEVGVDPEVAVLRLEKGEIDLMEDFIPSSQLHRLMSDPQWQPYIQHGSASDAYNLNLRPANKPYDDLRVRQAIYTAIDREKLVKVTGGLGQPAYGLFSPSSGDWYNADIARYDYDPDKAKALLAEAGYADGFQTDGWAYNVTPYPEIAQSIQQDLAVIGIDVDLHLVARPAWTASKQDPTHGLGFNQGPLEIPDPFYIVEFYFLCSSIQPEGCCNRSWTCDPERDEKILAAGRETDHAKRVEMYHELEESVTYDEVIHVPLYYPEWVFIHSPKVGGYTFPVVMAWTMHIPRYWSVTGE